MTNTPQPTTIIQDVVLPSWWATATTVQIVTPQGSATFDVGDVEFLSYGVTFPDNAGASWRAGIIPWSSIINVNKVT